MSFSTRQCYYMSSMVSTVELQFPYRRWFPLDVCLHSVCSPKSSVTHQLVYQWLLYNQRHHLIAGYLYRYYKYNIMKGAYSSSAFDVTCWKWKPSIYFTYLRSFAYIYLTVLCFSSYIYISFKLMLQQEGHSENAISYLTMWTEEENTLMDTPGT